MVVSRGKSHGRAIVYCGLLLAAGLPTATTPVRGETGSTLAVFTPVTAADTPAAECRAHELADLLTDALRGVAKPPVTPVNRVQLGTAGQQTYDSGRAAEGNHRANCYRSGNAQSQCQANARTERSREHNLERTTTQGDGANRTECAPGELQADGEEEKSDTEFGNRGDRFVAR